MRVLGRLIREQGGSELVEFALTAGIFLTVILGIVEVSRAMYEYHSVSNAAQEGVRYAIVRGGDWTSSCSTSAPPSFTLTYGCSASSTDVHNYVQSLPGMNTANVTATTSWPGGCKTHGCTVDVSVKYTFKFALPFLPQNSIQLTASSEQAIQQ